MEGDQSMGGGEQLPGGGADGGSSSAPESSAGPWAGLGLPDLPVISAVRGLRQMEGDQYDEMGQPLHGRSDYNTFRQFGKIWHSDAPPLDKLGQFWRWSNYTVPDAEQRRLETMRQWGVIPATEAERKLDQIEGSPLGAIAMGATALAGGSDRAQGLALDLGSAAEGTLTSAAALRAPVPAYLNAQRPSAQEPSAPASALSKWPATDADINALVAEHSKSNKVPLTTAAARTMLDQAQPFGTSVQVAGDNVAGPDVYFPGSSGTELQIKAVPKAGRFEQDVRKELRRQRTADQQGAESKASPVIAVQVPVGTNPAQLMGKLRNNFADHNVDKHSIVVVDTDGNVLIPKQRFPKQVQR
jgi:hypothetical protein